jgi:23S rRNA (cytidine1920-2'-O)/16S rRNA (cytidine1409-2'-O)-methyltransferase
VRVLERTNVRTITTDVAGPLDLLVADLSFISLAALSDVFARLGPIAMVLMVKPQFELPRDRVPKGGVVRELEAWIEAMEAVARAYRAGGYALSGVVPSPLTGPKGNREFFLHFVREGADVGDGLIRVAAEQAP